MEALILYSQRITINDILENDYRKEIVTRSVFMLIDSMYRQSEERNEFVEFFKMNLTNSEKVLNAKDLILEWASLPTNTETQKQNLNKGKL